MQASCHPERKAKKSGLCAQCHRRRNYLENHELNKQKLREYARKKKNKSNRQIREREKKYGMQVGDFEMLFEFQEQKCAICGAPPAEKPLAIDHCHKTGKVRGLLCHKCNMGLGMFLDRPELLDEAASYLRAHKISPGYLLSGAIAFFCGDPQTNQGNTQENPPGLPQSEEPVEACQSPLEQGGAACCPLNISTPAQSKLAEI